jgi:hypothetical protein
MEEQWLVAIKTYMLIIQLVHQVILRHLIFVYVRSVREISKSQRMVVVALVLLDELVCLANLDSDYGKDILAATFFKVEATKIRGKEIYSHGEDTYFLAILGGAGATTDSIFTY